MRATSPHAAVIHAVSAARTAACGRGCSASRAAVLRLAHAPISSSGPGRPRVSEAGGGNASKARTMSGVKPGGGAKNAMLARCALQTEARSN